VNVTHYPIPAEFCAGLDETFCGRDTFGVRLARPGVTATCERCVERRAIDLGVLRRFEARQKAGDPNPIVPDMVRRLRLKLGLAELCRFCGTCGDHDVASGPCCERCAEEMAARFPKHPADLQQAALLRGAIARR